MLPNLSNRQWTALLFPLTLSLQLANPLHPESLLTPSLPSPPLVLPLVLSRHLQILQNFLNLLSRANPTLVLATQPPFLLIIQNHSTIRIIPIGGTSTRRHFSSPNNYTIVSPIANLILSYTNGKLNGSKRTPSPNHFPKTAPTPSPSTIPSVLLKTPL